MALEQDEAQLVRDEAILRQAQMDLTRYETLSQQQSLARQTYEDQVWTVKQDQGTVAYDKAQIKAQQLNLAYCRIVAPTDGRVGLRLVDPGNYVQTSSTTGIVVLTTLKPTTVEFAVPEDSMPQITARVHAGAVLAVTAFDRANVTELAEGQLAAVDTQVNTTTGTVMLRAQFDNPDETLFPSQFVNVVMLLDTLKDVVTVPVGAVQRGAPGNYVYLVDDQNTVSVHPVKLGAQDGDRYAVESGLSPGDRVVTDGADRLRDGAKVGIPRNRRRPPGRRRRAPTASTNDPAITATGSGTGISRATRRSRTMRRRRSARLRNSNHRRRKPLQRDLRASDEPVPAVHPSAGRDLAADGGDPAGRRCSPSGSCRCRRCPRSTTRPSRCRPSIPARAPRS